MRFVVASGEVRFEPVSKVTMPLYVGTGTLYLDFNLTWTLLTTLGTPLWLTQSSTITRRSHSTWIPLHVACVQYFHILPRPANTTTLRRFLRSHGSEDAAIVNSTYFRQKDIFIAATRGNTELVAHYCGKEPAAAAKEDYDKRTPLHLAATEGHTNVVKMLLAAKADVNAEDRWGNCPLEGAIRHRHKGVIEILRDAGADAPGVHETQPSAGGGGGSAANEVVVELEDLAAASTEV